MVQVSGISYRIMVLGHTYSVIRIIDDQCVGAFSCHLGLCIVDSHIDMARFREVAQAVLRSAKVHWTQSRAPQGGPPSTQILAVRLWACASRLLQAMRLIRRAAGA